MDNYVEWPGACTFTPRLGERSSRVLSCPIQSCTPHGEFCTPGVITDGERLVEIKAMSDRLRSVREKLYDLLATKFKTPGTWSHIKKSVGMYW